MQHYHVIGVFQDPGEAMAAFDALGDAGFVDDARSLLGRRHPVDEHHIADLRPHFDPDEASGKEVVRLAGAASTDGLVGGAAGTALGLVTGAVALAIPGIGPAVGAGIWAYALGGGAVGVASGFVGGSLVHHWEVRYRDLVDVGRVLVGAHVDDRSQATSAVAVLSRFHPEDVEEFNAEG